jgi:hypothetical protein
MIELWEGFGGADTFWNGILATMNRVIYNDKHRFIGRLDVDRLIGVEGWTTDRKLVKLIQDLRGEGRL